MHSFSTGLPTRFQERVGTKGLLSMSAYLGILLFTAALSLATIWSGWNRHWPAIRGLRQQIAACPLHRELRVTVITVEVERASAVIHRPVFSRERQTRQTHSALRAA